MFPLRNVSLIGIFGILAVCATVVPASAQSQYASDRNVWQVRHQIEWDIQQLRHDQRDYRGLKERSIVDLQRSRNELLAAEQYIHGMPPGGYTGVNVDGPITRDQWRSNRNLWFVHRQIERQTAELRRDANYYGGHKYAAIRSLEAANSDIISAERYAHEFGY